MPVLNNFFVTFRVTFYLFPVDKPLYYESAALPAELSWLGSKRISRQGSNRVAKNKIYTYQNMVTWRFILL
jgi:hypothetical protein